MKKIHTKICLCLVIIILILGVNTCLAANISNETYVANFLVNIGVLNGYEDGSLRLNNTITREEFSKIIVLASSFKNDVDLLSPSSPFVDVTKERWSAPYVKVAAINNILKGYPDGEFKPTNNITLEEASVIALRILNYTSSDYGVSWPYSQVSYAKEKHILDNVNKNIGQEITRGDAINIIYNTLCSKINGTQTMYINMLDYSLVNDTIIIASKNQDKSIDSDKVLTSNGTYALNCKFDNSVIGCKSTIVLNLDGEVVSIIPCKQKQEKYSIVSAISNGIIVNDNGTNRSISLDNDITTYYKSQKTNLKSVANSINTGDVVHIFYDDLNNINYLLVESSTYSGPYVVKDNNWISEYNISNGVCITKNDDIADISDIEKWDVIYIYDQTNEISVYNNKISGMIEQFVPNKKNANSIVISGNTYLLETVDAYNSLQNYSLGDVVTLLLGKDGNVVDVIDSYEINKNDIGLLLSSTVKELTDNKGNKYTAYSVNVLLTNGNTTEYVVDKNYSDYENQIVRINFGEKVTLSKLGVKTNISGKIDANKYKLGSNDLSKDINIIEIPKISSKYVPVVKKIYLSRLDGINLNSQNIIYYTKNDDNKINNLIITDVTNDMYSYGLVLEENVLSDYTTLQVAYTLNLNGSEITVTTENKKFNVNKNEPVAVLLQNQTLKDINKLEKLTGIINNISIGSITISNKEYDLLSDVVVYKRISSGQYLTTNIQDVIDNKDKYNITVYYDSLKENGGRIRVLVVS